MSAKELKQINESLDSLKATVSDLAEKYKLMALSNSKVATLIDDIHRMTESINLKFDLVNNGVVANEQPKSKAKPKPKAKTKTPTETPADDAVSQTTETTEPSEEAPKRAVRKTTAKKAAVEEPPQEVKQEETKEAAPVKTTARKAKAATATPSTTRPINIMEFFKQAYNSNTGYFDEYLKPAIKDAIRKEHRDAWSELTGDALTNEERKTFYNWMKDNHHTELKRMKDDWIAEQATANIKIVEKE